MNYQMRFMRNYQVDPQIIILAAGNGSRMDSKLPKVMHEVFGKPMIEMALMNALEVTEDIVLVHSTKLLPYLNSYREMCKFVLQSTPLGTAHAVDSAMGLIDHEKVVIVLYGDNPLITSKIMKDLVDHLRQTKSSIVTLAFKRKNPAQYGRIVTDANGDFLKIVEFKDATDDEKKIQLCNSGIMAFAPTILEKYLPTCVLKSKQQKELYLTHIVEICYLNNEKVSYFLSEDVDLVVGVNTQEELAEASLLLQKHYSREILQDE